MKIGVVRPCSARDPFIVVNKPAGLPSAPLKEGDDSALTQALEMFPETRCVSSAKPLEHGLLHRLDTAASGLLLIAATQAAYDALSASQSAGLFIKGYSAHCAHVPPEELPEGFPPCEEKGAMLPNDIKKYTLTTRFRSFGRGAHEVRPVTASSSPAAKAKASPALYTTEALLDERECRARCRISRGFRHQVRCHLAWLGFPVHGDALYNPLCKVGEPLEFLADRLSFPHPVTGERVEITL